MIGLFIEMRGILGFYWDGGLREDVWVSSMLWKVI